MNFREPCFIYTPFQAEELAQELTLKKGAEYCVIREPLGDGDEGNVGIMEITLPDHTESSIELLRFELIGDEFFVEGTTFIPVVFKDLIDTRTILVETIPNRKTMQLKLMFDIRLA